jgi:hypothetical protein
VCERERDNTHAPHALPLAASLGRSLVSLAHLPNPLGPPYGLRHMLLKVPSGRLFLMSEIPLYPWG